ncbi:hypothetical protein H0H87_004007 [Tephrocybe sp. NHM501043]|nr:hypothetical protein H0H87_004007 [Tephrocybe sp. NHM501043]
MTLCSRVSTTISGLQQRLISALISRQLIDAPNFTEKPTVVKQENEEVNPVITSSEFAYKIRQRLQVESYTPRTWRTHPLHLLPSDPYIASDPTNKTVLNWIFLISCLNFSFWSEKEGQPDRYGVEWRDKWNSDNKKLWTGYWSLVASLNRALADDDIPITDPNFYSSELLCPDSLIEHVFRPAPQSAESIPLLKERIAIMREVGTILCKDFGGSFQGFLEEFHRRHKGEGTALQLVQMVVDTFPTYRDEFVVDGKQVYLWKRAQILVAETWAAFFPATPTATHPIFPGVRGPKIQQLTMFADYRVPQILHHLRILDYPPSLHDILHAGVPLPSGAPEELSLRATSIIAVERVRQEILNLFTEAGESGEDVVSSVLIDFYLWDLAKKIETGEDKIEGMETAELVPIHRTRSIWY